MMKIPYQSILHSKIDYDDYMHSENKNVIFKWIYKIYWKSTRKRIIKLLYNSVEHDNDITKNDIILFADFAMATGFEYKSIKVFRCDTRYIISFSANTDDHYKITVDTGTTSNVTYYLTEEINDKSRRSEVTKLNTTILAGFVIYDMIIDFIVEYLMA